MKKVIKIILDFLKPKCPNCNHPMDNTGEYFGSQVYSCDKCKTK